jgi:hypothetical protein
MCKNGFNFQFPDEQTDARNPQTVRGETRQVCKSITGTQVAGKSAQILFNIAKLHITLYVWGWQRVSSAGQITRLCVSRGPYFSAKG